MDYIFGAEGKILDIEQFLKEINEFSKENKCIIQMFDADLIYSKDHLKSSIKHAKRAFKNNTNTCNSLEMEILLYASGERQLKKAIPKMGVKIGDARIVFVLITKNKGSKIVSKFVKKFNFVRNDKVLKGSLDTLKKFGIKKSELTTVKEGKYCDLILEKIAMVDIIK